MLLSPLPEKSLDPRMGETLKNIIVYSILPYQDYIIGSINATIAV